MYQDSKSTCNQFGSRLVFVYKLTRLGPYKRRPATDLHTLQGLGNSKLFIYQEPFEERKLNLDTRRKPPSIKHQNPSHIQKWYQTSRLHQPITKNILLLREEGHLSIRDSLHHLNFFFLFIYIHHIIKKEKREIVP